MEKSKSIVHVKETVLYRCMNYIIYNVDYQEFKVIKKTEKGFWINVYNNGGYKKKWVNNYSRKRFAYPTKKEALIYFCYRKMRFLQIMENNVYNLKVFVKRIEFKLFDEFGYICKKK